MLSNHVPQESYTEWAKSPSYANWEEYLTNVFTRIVRDITRFKPAGRVLEIGSSLGYLLTVLGSAGFEAEGIEPSEYAVKYSRQRGLKVAEGYFPSDCFPEESFDIVILNHVLEHIQSPNLFLARIRDVLKEDGVIFVGLPNFGSIEAQLLGRHWRFLMADQHYFQFDPATLTRILVKNGFDILDLKTTVSFTDLANPWQEFGRACLKDRKRMLYYLLDFLPATVQLLLHRGYGLQAIAAKR